MVGEWTGGVIGKEMDALMWYWGFWWHSLAWSSRLRYPIYGLSEKGVGILGLFQIAIRRLPSTVNNLCCNTWYAFGCPPGWSVKSKQYLLTAGLAMAMDNSVYRYPNRDRGQYVSASRRNWTRQIDIPGRRLRAGNPETDAKPRYSAFEWTRCVYQSGDQVRMWKLQTYAPRAHKGEEIWHNIRGVKYFVQPLL